MKSQKSINNKHSPILMGLFRFIPVNTAVSQQQMVVVVQTCLLFLKRVGPWIILIFEYR